MSEISDERLEAMCRMMEVTSGWIIGGIPVSELAQIARELQARRKAAQESHDELERAVCQIENTVINLRRRIEALEARPVGGYPYPVYVPCEPSPWRVTWTNTTSTTGEPR
ncbi:MAG: hypothetical protein WC683_18480 [bacterium]